MWVGIIPCCHEAAGYTFKRSLCLHAEEPSTDTTKFETWNHLWRQESIYFFFSSSLKSENTSPTTCSACVQCHPGHVGTNCRDELKTCVEKFTITCSYFSVLTNKIYIIVSTEVPDFPKTYPSKFCITIVCKVLSSVVLGNKSSQDCPTLHVPRYMSHMIFSKEGEMISNDNLPPGELSRWKKSTPTIKFTSFPKLNFHNKTVSPSSLHHQEYSHHYTTSPLEKRRGGTIEQEERWADTKDNTVELPHTYQDVHHWHAGRKSKRLKYIW